MGIAFSGSIPRFQIEERNIETATPHMNADPLFSSSVRTQKTEHRTHPFHSSPFNFTVIANPTIIM